MALKRGISMAPMIIIAFQTPAGAIGSLEIDWAEMRRVRDTPPL